MADSPNPSSENPTDCPACSYDGHRVRLFNGLCRTCGYDARPPSAFHLPESLPAGAGIAPGATITVHRPNPFTTEVDEWGEGEWLACAGHVDLDDFLVRCQAYARTQWSFKDEDLAEWDGLVGEHRWARPHHEFWTDDDEPYVQWCEADDGGWPITVLVVS